MTDEHSTLSGHETGDGRQLGPGTRLGQFELREPLGAGAMGQVWKAWDTPGRRDVALKLLPKEFRGNPEAMEQVRLSFEQVHGLTHQSIGKTLALLEDPMHGPYLAMDLIAGVPLSSFARQARQEGKQFGVKQVVKLLTPVAEALDYAHRRNVLHRDIKPQNILVQLQPFFQVVLIDFGLAAAIRSTLTQHTKGTIDSRGTRPYMSPEQIRGKARQWDGRTDQYSLAVVAYELLSGYLPFQADDDFAFMYAIIHEPADPIEGLPESVNAALLTGLAKERQGRHASCIELITALLEDPAPAQVPSVPPKVSVAPAETVTPPPAKLTPPQEKPIPAPAPRPPEPVVAKPAPDVIEVLLTGLGESIGEVEVSEILVAVGDHVSQDQLLLEVQTDKATAAVPSPQAGQVAALRVSAGDVIPVGTVVALIHPAVSGDPASPRPVEVSRHKDLLKVTLTNLGDSVEEAFIGELFVSEGDRISAGQRLIEIEMEKSTFDLLSEQAGTIVAIHVAAGELVRRDQVLVEIQPGSGQQSPLAELFAGEHAGDLWKDNSLGMKLRWCPPGSFVMGSPPNEEGRKQDEQQVRVTLTRGFWLGQHVVTQSEFEAVMQANRSVFIRTSLQEDTSQHPVENVSWEEAVNFCRKLTERERAVGTLPLAWRFTLPTEAQWEYACRSGITAATAFGPAMSWKQAHIHSSYPDNVPTKHKHRQQTVAVGSFQPNLWQLYDMHGNVSEWCLDCYSEQLPGGENPEVVKSGHGTRVYRGGNWTSSGQNCRSAYRASLAPGKRDCFLGFRVALIHAEAQESSAPQIKSILQTSPPVVKPPVPPAGTEPFSQKNKPPGDLWEGNRLGIKFRWCPAGSFTMGSPPGERDRGNDEDQEQVTLPEGFWLGQCVVTQEEWKIIVGTTPWMGKADAKEGRNYPAIYVSWEDANDYCVKLTMDGYNKGWLPKDWKIDLPTEMQWEYACRAGTQSRWSFGDAKKVLGEYAWFKSNAAGVGEKYPHQVGLKKPNAWGFFDMHGNVWEWCRDWSARQLPGGSAPEVGQVLSQGRVARGGSWDEIGSRYCRSASRRMCTPEYSYNDLGFRVALIQTR